MNGYNKVAVIDADANNIALPSKNPSDPGFIEEGGPLSRTANLFGGMNAMSVFHDAMTTDIELAMGSMSDGYLFRAISISTIFMPAIPLNYVGLGIQSTIYENRLLTLDMLDHKF